jgi:CheY-like chemotaxis protein/nitrogen-specific signal transduction histidine kinase/HPt (histidine-containing phosphotransfer) domain-containing protein
MLWNNQYKAVLEQARKDAEELAKAKELFLANMSHEIRTPMNIISGFLSQLMKSQLNNEQREQLSIIKKSSDHLLNLLNDLLDLSKLQAGKLELVETNFSPSEIIHEINRSFELSARIKNVQINTLIDPAIPDVVYGDPVRLRQILFNLVGNAIKFTDHGNVSVRSFIREQNNERIVLVFEIADTGIGMNETDMELIFGDFEKASGSPGANDEGAGLGLSITRKLLNLHGGNIRVESQNGKGSTFTVEIPYQKRKENITSQSWILTGSNKLLKDLRILVVDDDEYNRRLAKIILEKYDCRVFEAGSAEEGIAMMDRSAIDLVLMDIRLPGMKGPEAAGAIKQLGRKTGIDIPVIAVSAAITKSEIEKFRQSGLDHFVLKPYDEETLVRVISQFTSKVPAQNPDEPGSVPDAEISSIKGHSPEYDLAPLKKSSGGNEVFFREMVTLFLHNTDEGLSRLQENIEQKEWEAAAELAHKMISPCRHLKASGLIALLKQIENTLGEPVQPDSAAKKVAQARTEFERIKEDIKL